MQATLRGKGSCGCGRTQFAIHGAPLMRSYCHCTICQEFNQAPYADITVFRARDVSLPPEGQVDYRTWRAPPAVNRGRCVDCDAPAVERLKLIGLPELVIVPTANLQLKAPLPDPCMHGFYNRRVQDVDDQLPRYNGYVPSTLALTRFLLPALILRQVG